MTTYLSEYAHFKNKHDLDAATRQHILAYWNEMNQTERAVLEMIRRYSVKYGAAHLKHETFVKAIKKSNATVRRAIRKLVKLEIIERIHYIRPVKSGLGANIYVIQPTNDQSKLNRPKNDEKPSASRAEPAKPQTETCLSKAINNKNLKRTSPPKIVPTTLFGKMKSLLSSAIGESKLARIFYGVYRKESLQMLKFSIHEDKGGLFKQLAKQALRIPIQTTKLKKSGICPAIIQAACANSSTRLYSARLSWIMTCHLRVFSINTRKVPDGHKQGYKTYEQW
ncbi:helix-turn-helix domain-containing protein [Sporosarcina sp. JAI121]|uniref:helix-turn-helix domain-containing protein n=1 Tax=Sporosarcina sp. JAI121 TaxID=2723064 RepID=UPI0017D74659|nr:helix-turn-helix domain-containing protein [Sporosarcina sp. JAI121]NYF23933.1 putative transcriptional regulator [Sporosarcina sp. JAI121]